MKQIDQLYRDYFFSRERFEVLGRRFVSANAAERYGQSLLLDLPENTKLCIYDLQANQRWYTWQLPTWGIAVSRHYADTEEIFKD